MGKSMKKIFVLVAMSVAMFCIVGCECESSERTCTGGWSYYCKDNSWELDEICSNGCTDGFCNSPCSDYQYECWGSSSFYCYDEGWFFAEECENGCNESTGKCNTESPNDNIACSIQGSFRCKGNMLQKCDNDYWRNIQECGGSQICSAETKSCEDKKEEKPVEEICETVAGRMWSPRASVPMYWPDAVSYCNSLTACGYSDWYLPTINELRTLIRNCPATEPGTSSCYLEYENGWFDCHCSGCSEDNSGKYSKLGDAYWYWSSTSQSDLGEYVLCGVYFSTGEIGTNGAYNGGNVRCVR